MTGEQVDLHVGNKRSPTRKAVFAALTSMYLIYCIPAYSEEATTKIVGLGAMTCAEFINEVQKSPNVQRDYLAWAQGFMSGILLSRPQGIDEGLDLNPSSFGLLKQLEFLRDHCAQTRSEGFSEAVVALYKRLRKEAPSASSER
jgi:hypothetical protein